MVKLSDVVDEMEMQGDQISAFLHLSSGEIVTLSSEAFSALEDDICDDDYEDWELKDIELAKKTIETDEYLQLPTPWEIDEVSMMRRFCDSLGGDLRAEMLNLIGGKGTFQRFKNATLRHDIRDAWHDYKQAALEEFAAEWLQEHDVLYEGKAV